MFGILKSWFKKQDVTIYIRFRKEKVYLTYLPSHVTVETLPIIAVEKKGKDFKVSAVGREVLDLPTDSKAVVYTPFEPFSFEPENFEMAERCLQYLLRQGLGKSALIAPKVVIHPDKSYLSEMEEQAYRELALSAGSREVVVYIGKMLNSDEVLATFEKNR